MQNVDGEGNDYLWWVTTKLLPQVGTQQ